VIVVETSAIVAVLLDEAEASAFETLIAENEAHLPVACYVEAGLALRHRGHPLGALDGYIVSSELSLLGSDERQARIAAEADRRFGRGTGHPARLNFGDCLAYAAAMAHDAPLLFKGDDFAHTDVRRAA
jgi:ribonuclease VapC